MDTIPFGELLNALRKQHHISQQKLSGLLAVHRNTVSNWERGFCLPETKTIVLEIARQLRLDDHDTRRLLDASLTTPSPYWDLPYQRNPFFTGREEILQRLHEAFHADPSSNQSFALSGLGGVGKTQIAVEYAYRFATDYTAVFWINAETAETLASSFAIIADKLNLPEKEEAEQSRMVAAIIRWLNSHSGWLLIYDNVEDPNLVKGCLPAARSGSLIFTTRRHALGLNAENVDVAYLPDEEAIHLLLRRAGMTDSNASLDALSQSEISTAREIVALMGGLPLALDQAGAYANAIGCSLSDYLNLFQSSQFRLLDERHTHIDHPLSVTKTFTLAFDHLERNHRLAAEILTACAFLAPEAIPDFLLTEGAASLGSGFEALVFDPFAFQIAIKALLSFSLIHRDASAHTITVHRLVQVVLREHLSESERRTWTARVLHAMAKFFPSEKAQSEYWQKCAGLLSHALTCLMLGDQTDHDIVERITLMSNVAPYLANRARFLDAEELYQRALHLIEHDLDAEHPIVAEVLYGLGILYRQLGRYAEAEPLYQRALRIREVTLGVDHLQVAYSLTSLALLYREQGKYVQAEEAYQQAMRMTERLEGPDHMSIPPLLSNLADLYREQGRYAEAEALFHRAISVWKQALGVEHPNLVYPLNNLADLYLELGRYAEAEPLYRQALANWEREFGPQHPLIAYPLLGLAAVYQERGECEQAKALYERALQIREQTLGAEHLLLADSLIGLATLYTRQENYQQAEPLYQRALALRQQHLDPQHPLIAECLHYLAQFHQFQQHNSEARSLYQQALFMREQALGMEHPKTQATRSAYMRLRHKIGSGMIREAMD